ncbi:hypothetical protein GCM10010873_14560 [Cypionkella aquatica]|uniref:Uncharacterized protein n=1 Tax=Cypionkella aquatica TaxID=1756042 RepID=A0AA37TS11_9RHOB|nr:hypothetical protein [Cypionkella aquatica]GLS86482.1 hypothetical protein GCM10010873_14560 [Cypionkella aquatica]
MSDLISAVALFVSILAIWQTHRQASNSERLTEQEIELVRQQLASNRRSAIEERQAGVSARMFKDGKGWKVRVFNAGLSEAKNVRLVLDDQNQLVTENAVRGKFPMARMERGQSVDFLSFVHMASPDKETLTIQWDDASGKDRENQVEITT